jgi:aspartyl-tRNA(Asn)/glutamyl-tRNA(Gln) amidotransferase subunit B
MEEDAGKNLHDVGGGSGVDLNRAGVPLLEIVSEPDLRSIDEAIEYLKSLRAILMYLGVNDGNLEEGSFRCDANVSIRRRGDERLGTRCELKNMNSFRFLRQAIDYEVRRQVDVVESGGSVEQETRLFDPERGETRSMRSKEEAHDYRYFPEPDLVPLAPTEEMLERARTAIPELPAARAERFERELGLPEETARMFAFRTELGDYYEAAVAADSADVRTLANWVRNELVQRIGEADPAESNVTPAALARLVGLVEGKTVSQSAAKEVLAVLVEEGGDPQAIIEERGLALAGSDELESIVERALEADPEAVEAIRSGNQKAIGALMGAVMRETKGRADGKEVQRLIRERIGG